MRSGASSVLNLLATVVTVRWFGADVYASYVVDLALLSVGMVLLEIVPSNYSVFRMQDDPSWKDSVAAQIILTMLVAIAAVIVVGLHTSLFRSYTAWMALYAATVAAKRYLDLRLQSSGRLPEFMNLEFSSSAIRLALLIFCFVLQSDPTFAVWGSLAIASALSQAVWWVCNSSELRVLAKSVDRHAWLAICKEFPKFIPYYSGIVLKRIKDNLVPLVAEMLFSPREVLALFFLSYRGVVFAVGQIRILEALMNHRVSLERATAMSATQLAMLTLVVHILCLIASTALLIASGLNELPWFATFVMSFMVWPVAYLVMERSKAYSQFQASWVNGSIIVYIVGVGTLSLVMKTLGLGSLTSFALTLVISELFAVIFIKAKNRSSDATPY